MFNNISNFNNVNDYLPILNGCIYADLIVIFFVYHGIFKSYFLQKWYKNYQLSAVLADVLILVIGIILTRFFYGYFFTTFNIFKFTGLAVFIQIIHDLLFYSLFNSSPIGYNAMFDFFKKYAKESGIKAILGDSFMIIIACFLSSYFSTYSLNMNIITLIINLYFFPYMINYL
jgi:hypothetical protein